MFRYRAASILTVLLVLTGCTTYMDAAAGRQLKQNEFAQTLIAWKGRSVDELVAAWGMPTRQRPTVEGGAELYYIYGEGIGECQARFRVLSDRTVDSVGFDGPAEVCERGIQSGNG